MPSALSGTHIYFSANETYGVAILSDGSRGFVTDRGSNKVFQFDPDTETVITDALFPVTTGSSPRGIAAHLARASGRHGRRVISKGVEA